MLLISPGRCDPCGIAIDDHLTDERPGGGAEAGCDPELAAERVALERIRRAQADRLARAVSQAERLAAEAAEMTEEGIRDIFDEDAEADAAVQAALVRQTAERAMHAVRRVNELRSAGRALAFGHTTDASGEQTYIGRLTVFEGDEPLLIDWRAPAAVPFYRATPLKRMEVERRRNLLYGDEASGSVGELVGYSDELFDPDEAAEGIGLRGEAALLASITAPTRDQMRSVVATIQAEQDAIIRAPDDEPLLVQGGPGTGKTVVALHRAAYLLYAQREALSDTGVLIIGPSPEFLAYIAGVLPSLGETGVVSVTAPELYPGVRRGEPEDPEVAALKGRLDMADLLANAIADRRRCPTETLNVWYGARRVSLPVQVLADLFDRAGQYPTHNEGADYLRFELIETLAGEVFDPSFHNRDDARDHFRRSDDIRTFLLRHWPPLTPEHALNDLLGSRGLLRRAARGTAYTDDELASFHRPRHPFAHVADIRWSNADIPLLDELLAIVGISLEGLDDDERIKERDVADEFELASEIDDKRTAADSAARRSRAALAGVVADPSELGDVELDRDSDLIDADLVDTGPMIDGEPDFGGESLALDDLAEELAGSIRGDGTPFDVGLDAELSAMFDPSVLDERFEGDADGDRTSIIDRDPGPGRSRR